MSRQASTKPRIVKTTNLGHVLKRWRLIDDLSMRAAAAILGISAATLLRLEMGHKADQDTWIRLLNWLAQTRKE